MMGWFKWARSLLIKGVYFIRGSVLGMLRGSLCSGALFWLEVDFNWVGSVVPLAPLGFICLSGRAIAGSPRQMNHRLGFCEFVVG